MMQAATLSREQANKESSESEGPEDAEGHDGENEG